MTLVTNHSMLRPHFLGGANSSVKRKGLRMKKSFVLAAAVVIAGASAAWFWFAKDPDAPSEGNPNASMRAESHVAEPTRLNTSEKTSVGTTPSALEANSSLSQLLIDSIALAEAGDAAAARTVAEILQYCWVINVDVVARDKHIQEQMKRRPESAAAIARAHARQKERCSGVMGGEAYTDALVAEWLSRASEGGDVAALVKLSYRAGDIPADDSKELLSAVVSAGDPNAVRDAGTLINFLEGNAEGDLMPLVNSQLGVQAWQVAACRLGASCGSGSVLMDSICVSSGICGFNDYEAVVRSQWVPQGRAAEFERLVNHAESVLRGD